MENMKKRLTPNQLVGFYLKQKRLELGLTGTEVGKLLCVSQQQISRYERGSNMITLDFAVLFFKKMELEIEDLFDYLVVEIRNRTFRAAEVELSYYVNSLPEGNELPL